MGKVKLDLGALQECDLNKTTIVRQRAHVAWQIVTTNHIKDQVRTTLRFHLIDKIHIAIVHRHLRAEVQTRAAFGVRSSGGEHPRAKRMRQLDRGGANAG